MSTVRIYKVAELLNTTSQEVLALLKKNHGIELKSASSTLEEIVARQFVDRLARQRGIELPKGDIFSEAAAKSVKKTAGGPKKGTAPTEPAKPAASVLPPPRLIKTARPPAPPVVKEPEPEPVVEPAPVEEAPIVAAAPPPPLSRSSNRRPPSPWHRPPRPLRRSRRRQQPKPKPKHPTHRSSRPPPRRPPQLRRSPHPAVSCRPAFACASKNRARRRPRRRRSSRNGRSCRRSPNPCRWWRSPRRRRHRRVLRRRARADRSVLARIRLRVHPPGPRRR